MPAVGETFLGARATSTTMAQQGQHNQSPECSNCEHCGQPWAARSRAGARVSVSLRRFFSDERACLYMWAPYGRSVEWLRRRLVREYRLREDVALSSRGRLLPAGEPLLILENNDEVEVIYTSNICPPHGLKEDRDGAVYGNTNTISETTSQTETTVQSNKSIIQENLTSCPRVDIVESHNHLESLPFVDMDSTMGSIESQSVDDIEDLQRLKQRALRLLDEQCHVLQQASEPKRLRRRRRRRKAPAAGLPSDDGEPRDWAAGAVEAAGAAEAAEAAEAAGASVVRNGCGSRPARLVRALSPPSHGGYSMFPVSMCPAHMVASKSVPATPNSSNQNAVTSAATIIRQNEQA